MNRTLVRAQFGAWIAVALALGSCAKSGDPPAAASAPGAAAKDHQDDDGEKNHQDEEAHAQLPTRITLSPEVVVATGLLTAPAVVEALPETVQLTGEVTADPDRSARISVRVPGRIVDVKFREGDRVKAGALLAVIESPELARARAAAGSAQARAGAARRNADRLARVGERGLAAGQEVEGAEAEARALEADARAARQTLHAYGPAAAAGGDDAARLELRAPIAGVVLARDAVRGQTVGADHQVAVLADLGIAAFTARLFEKDLARVRRGAAAEVRLNAWPGEVFVGRVESIGKQLDPAARTVVARITIPDHDDLLKVGLFGTAQVVVPGAKTAPRLVVAASAVTQIGERNVVFVRQPDGHFELHRITLGHGAAGKVEILSGLRPGEQVVHTGVFTLKSAVLKSTFGEE
ncbi:MAG: efflux RND transporter periplasmic adaptor subunit [Myxococcales bacterium]|nr:efflux RND transporter periplasmic adaptor subunit [Myxococcales bacterium]